MKAVLRSVAGGAGMEGTVNILLFFSPRTRTMTDVPADVSNLKCLIFFTREEKV